jgi:hypothetical protein
VEIPPATQVIRGFAGIYDILIRKTKILDAIAIYSGIPIEVLWCDNFGAVAAKGCCFWTLFLRKYK